MNKPGHVPIFIDTAAFYARFCESDQNHSLARELFDAIHGSENQFRPLATSQIVLAELSSLLLRRPDGWKAHQVVPYIYNLDSITVFAVGQRVFRLALEQFEQYSDQQIDLIDHTTSVLAEEHDINHILTFDSDFRTLGFTVVPGDVSPTDA